MALNETYKSAAKVSQSLSWVAITVLSCLFGSFILMDLFKLIDFRKIFCPNETFKIDKSELDSNDNDDKLNEANKNQDYYGEVRKYDKEIADQINKLLQQKSRVQ